MDERTPPVDDATSQTPTPEERLAELRAVMREVTDRLIALMGERRDLAVRIGKVKKELGLPVLDPAREARVVRQAAARARELGVDAEMARDILWRIIASARDAQSDRPSGWPGRRAPGSSKG